MKEYDAGRAETRVSGVRAQAVKMDFRLAGSSKRTDADAVGAARDVHGAIALSMAREHRSHVVGRAPTGRADALVSMNSSVPDFVEFTELSSKFLCGATQHLPLARPDGSLSLRDRNEQAN